MRSTAPVPKALPGTDGSVYLLSGAAVESPGGVGWRGVGPQPGTRRLAYVEVSYFLEVSMCMFYLNNSLKCEIKMQ